MKKLLIALPLLSAALFNTAMAENNVEKQMPKQSNGGPMAVFKQTSPMPLLMGVIAKQGDKLDLTDKQSAVFTQWRVDNMASSLKIGNEIIAGDKAINQAAIDGKSNAEIEKMLTSVLEKRHTLASNMLTCRDMIKKTLDEGQWEKFIALYSKQNKGMMHSH
ncbi:MAG: hypothetical protein KAH20_06275 [Methylococcales bacterium]|nr:hypothetical protein [Methylococcales bacterium]